MYLAYSIMVAAGMYFALPSLEEDDHKWDEQHPLVSMDCLALLIEANMNENPPLQGVM